MKRLKTNLLRFLAASVPAAALLVALPVTLLANKPAPTTPQDAPVARKTAVNKAIAPANQQAAEVGFDAFLQASLAGLPNAPTKSNALVALYGAIGLTVDQNQAAAFNANNSRDLLYRMSTRDTSTALSGGWTLNISTNNFDGISLSLLSFLQYFPNLTGISLVALPGTTAPNPASFAINSLNDIAWIGALKGLRTLRIVNDPAKNAGQLSADGLAFLQGLPLTTADFSRFLSVPAAGMPTRPIFASLDLAKDWYLTMRYNFTIIMPANYAMTANNALYTVSTGDGTTTTITKAVAPRFANPTSAYRTVYVDGGRWDAVLADSQLIWPLSPAFIAEIAFTDATGNYYKTGGTNRFPVTKRTLTAAETALYNRYDTESRKSGLDIFQVLRLESTSASNATYIGETVIVDGEKVPRVMVNGTLYWAFDQTKALFRNDKLTKFWTSYERISAEDLASPLPGAEVNRVQTISRSIAEQQVDRSQGYLTAIDPPTSEAQVFYVNETPVGAIRDLRDTSQQKYFWDFNRQGFRPDQIMFYSKSTLRAFTSINELVRQQGTNNFNYAAYSSAKIASFDSIPTDTDPANRPSDIRGIDAIAAYLAKNTDAKISIDGQLYGYVLRNGTLYVDFDTSLINFVVVVNNARFYYTTDSKIPANQVSNVKLLEKIAPRTIPNQRAIQTPNLSAVNESGTTILINNAETLQYGINNGKLYWRFAGSTVSGLSKIRYVGRSGDQNSAQSNVYYTLSMFDLPAEVIVNQALTEVVPTPDDVNATSSGFSSSLLLSQQIDKTNYFVIGLFDRITIDNASSYTRRIAHSKVYWLDSSGVPLASFASLSLQEFDGTADNLVESPFFYTTTRRAFDQSKSFPEKIRQITPPLVTVGAADLNPVEIKDPTDLNASLKVYTKGVLVTLLARRYSDVDTPFIWSDKEIVDQIKYAARQADGSYVYFTELSDQIWDTPGITSDDISEVKVDVAQAVITRDALFQDNVFEINVVKYALIGVFSALFVAAAAVFVWRVFRKRVRNG